MSASTTPPASNGSAGGEPQKVKQMERIAVHDQVPGHDNYYEKNGLRTYGDGEDHDHEPPMSPKRFMSLTAMAFLWTGSQLPMYLFGGVPPYIYGDIGGVDRWIWLTLANLIASAAVCPFVGSLSDLLGRRYVALIGMGFLILGMIVCSTANVMNVFIGGMTLTGIGAGMSELTALAGTSELAPTAKRGKYNAGLILTILPWCPSVLWSQLIATHGGWRWCGLLGGLWMFLGFLVILFFYFPPPRINSTGLTRKQLIAQIDFVGGFLSVAGMILFLAGLQWGGYQYKWSSAHVLAPLLLGAALLVAFGLWESYGAKYPMFPARIKQAPRILALTLVITFISGANFISLLMFWPTQSFNVYGHDPVEVGLRGLPVAFCVMVGAVINLSCLSIFKGRNKEIMIISCVLMTAGVGALSCADRFNMYRLWGILVLAGLGTGGIIIPAAVITTIICPDDLIATVTALTLAVRVIGGAIGYCVYYNVFVNKFVPNAVKMIGGVMELELHIMNKTYIETAIGYTSASLLPLLKTIPGIAGNDTAYEMVVLAGQEAFAASYRYIYYVSLAFGGVSILSACFLGDIGQYMDDHVAVVMH